MSKRKDRKRYNNGSRQDYTKGGRVGYAEGGAYEFDDGLRNIRNGQYYDPVAAAKAQQAAADAEKKAAEDAAAKAAADAEKKAAEDAAKAAEEAKKAELRQSIDAAAAGKLPESIEVSTEDLSYVDPTIEQKTTTLEKPKEVVGTFAEETPPEVVTTVDETKEAKKPTEVKATTYEADLIKEAAEAEAAKGKISEQAIADTIGIGDVKPIDEGKVTVEPGALAERVVGTLSEDAKAVAAINAGTSLSRITRAKKQLSKAGLSNEEIAEIGNDPEALEARLADFSEEQRGIIEGLPEEALISTQINGLLEGIENGKIPVWARPAVTQVEQMLAQRGMSASTVGRDSLFNAIIQAAMPIAQNNAQAIQQSVAQQKDIEFKTEEANTQRRQQIATDNANKVFNLNMAQFNADQQTEIINSQFMQTVSLKNADNKQKAALQEAVLLSQKNIAEADLNTKINIQNAQAFLAMDMANLNNEQQANVLNAQLEQQRLLSNQAAQNAALKFGATTQNQVDQFNSSLAAQVEQFNVNQLNAMAQFNATQKNAAAARDAQRNADREQFNAKLRTQVEEFNSSQEFTRNQWNASNRAAVEASNVSWRRQSNTANTAAQNAATMNNAQNAFNLSTTALSFLWQEMRDQADYTFRSSENEKARINSIITTALASDPNKYTTALSDMKNLISAITGDII